MQEVEQVQTRGGGVSGVNTLETAGTSLKVRMVCKPFEFKSVGREFRFRGNVTESALSDESPQPQDRESCRCFDSCWFLGAVFFFTPQQLPGFCLRVVQQAPSDWESLEADLLMQQQSLLDFFCSAQRQPLPCCNPGSIPVLVTRYRRQNKVTPAVRRRASNCLIPLMPVCEETRWEDTGMTQFIKYLFCFCL